MNSYLQIKGFLCQGNTIELLGGWSTLSFENKVEKIKNWLKKQIILSKEGTSNDPSFGEIRTSSFNKLQTISRKIQRQGQGPQKKERSWEQLRQGKQKENWYRIPKLETLAVESVFNMSRTLMQLTVKGQKGMNRTSPCK
ncbi:hypothetical protein O181_013178 [Austropuccinia psidii MF-1]|uniref:Uncharacterized protein n=1 Tax=Austropuccinia psidii MF-1 TaxID=1389203 RepID=A0A9Q3BY72_9BASI|nr:hypothetical protein [Austropuccinia psidii MF-1]